MEELKAYNLFSHTIEFLKGLEYIDLSFKYIGREIIVMGQEKENWEHFGIITGMPKMPHLIIYRDKKDDTSEQIKTTC